MITEKLDICCQELTTLGCFLTASHWVSEDKLGDHGYCIEISKTEAASRATFAIHSILIESNILEPKEFATKINKHLDEMLCLTRNRGILNE